MNIIRQNFKENKFNFDFLMMGRWDFDPFDTLVSSLEC